MTTRWFAGWGAGLLLWVASISASAAEKPGGLEQRWVYLQTNLQVDESANQAVEIAKRAAAAGYNGIVYADFKLNVLDRVTERYFRNVARFRKTCDELQLEIIPCVAPFGYSEGILMHDPNLAEGLPAKEVPFVVRDGVARCEAKPHPRVRGDFEEAQGDAFVGWGFQDDPGAGTWRDTDVKRGGGSSLRIENPPGVSGVNRRISRRLPVRPYSQWHLSVWIKTEDFSEHANMRLFALGNDGRTLAHQNLGVQRTQDWTKHEVMLNSLENSEIGLYCGVWGAKTGRLWLDDLRVIEAPLVNLVRRDDCPFEVKTKSGRVLKEGRDFEPVRDQTMIDAHARGVLETYHEPPVIRLKREAGVKEGTELLVSYYHAVSIYDGQVPASLSADKSFEIVRKQMEGVRKLLEPKRLFFSHDEIRVANWSAAEVASGRTAGQTLAENLRRCRKLANEVVPGAALAVWGDMFDPHHNARPAPFYLVNGTLEGSWEGLDKETLIINWNSGEPEQSPRFFAGRGNPQVLAGYYDGPADSIRGWLDKSRGTSVTGVMYTTWRTDFSNLEAFAKAAWGER